MLDGRIDAIPNLLPSLDDTGLWSEEPESELLLDEEDEEDDDEDDEIGEVEPRLGPNCIIELAGSSIMVQR